MVDFDDRDIRIFVKNESKEDNQSLIRLAEEMTIQRNNGNIAKAVTLGEKIANLISNIDAIDDGDFRKLINNSYVDQKVLYQVRLLLTFTAESTLHRSVNIPMLSTTAVNAMYDVLINSESSFYEDTTDAFTFYYIALRKQNNIAARIGRRFAMLCGKENHENLEKIGSGLYLILCRIICEEIENTSFIID